MVWGVKDRHAGARITFVMTSRFVVSICAFWIFFPVQSSEAAHFAINGVEAPQSVSWESLKKAERQLAELYGGRFTLDQSVQERLNKLGPESPAAELLELARELMASHPLLKEYPLLVTIRPQYKLDHHNTETLFQLGEINTEKFEPGGALKLLNLSEGKATDLISPGAEGLIRDPDVAFDGKKVLFSWRKNIQDGYHVYEVQADGSGVRQLTSLSGVSDIDPAYLPNGDIVFSSSRQPKFCMCNRHIMANLYRMEGDGANPHPIGRSTLFEGHSVVLDDGRILYDRWEYVDRNFGDAQGLWTVNPDGTNHMIYWGNNTKNPGGVIDARPIPGTGSVLAVLAACHDRPWGGLGIINRTKGLDGPEPVERTWPADYHQHMSQFGNDCYDSPLHFVKNRYEDPYPLDAHFFLASRALNAEKYGEKTGIFLLDTLGNEILLYADDSPMGAYDPMLLMSRPLPRVHPDTVRPGEKTGTFFLQNVYEGTHMKDVKPGEIKYLRIVESPEKRTWTQQGWVGQGEQAPAMNWHSFENKRILGVVPVEKDGSASFIVPADRFVYFQALDAEGNMVQSMRSGTMVRPGEFQSCVGCHEDRLMAPPSGVGVAQAGKRAPSKMTAHEPGEFSYLKNVQPVWDKNCISCHDFGKPGAEKLNLAGDLTMPFNVSYTELWGRGYIACVGGGPAETQQAKSWGSLRSKLIQVLLAGHNDVKLSAEDWQTIKTWVDLNGVYYPTYDSSYPDGVFGRGPLTPAEFGHLLKLANGKLTRSRDSRGKVWISLSRPEVSPILKEVDAACQQEILKLLQLGKERLQKTPRADMDGFRPAAFCQKQLDKYKVLEISEQKVKKAMIEGKKLYDRDLE